MSPGLLVSDSPSLPLVSVNISQLSVGPVPLVLDLHIAHVRFGSSSDPSIRSDYNNRPSHDIAFMSAIASTSGRLHCEFVFLLFLQTHREIDRFLSSSGVHLPGSMTPPEDRVITLYVGLLANHDRVHNLHRKR
jgi:hypothetical protein